MQVQSMIDNLAGQAIVQFFEYVMGVPLPEGWHDELFGEAEFQPIAERLMDFPQDADILIARIARELTNDVSGDKARLMLYDHLEKKLEEHWLISVGPTTPDPKTEDK